MQLVFLLSTLSLNGTLSGEWLSKKLELVVLDEYKQSDFITLLEALLLYAAFFEAGEDCKQLLVSTKLSDDDEQLELEDPSDTRFVRVASSFPGGADNWTIFPFVGFHIWFRLFFIRLFALLLIQYSSKDFSLWMGGIASSL